MKINVCIPTRNKPQYLKEYLTISQENAFLPTTQFVVAADEDDEFLPAYERFCDQPGVILSVKPREDALGQKFNRCVSVDKADIYVMAVDDVGIITPGWDMMLAKCARDYTDDLVNMQFGVEPHGEYIPGFQAITHRMVELQGGLAPPYFPFWWHNTWAYEIAELCGRGVPVPIVAKYPKIGEFPSAPRRDICMWAEVFDAMRPLRVQAADRIMAASDNNPERNAKLHALRPQILAAQLYRNAKLRDPVEAARFEKDMSLPDPLTDRHIRLRHKAAEALEALAA